MNKEQAIKAIKAGTHVLDCIDCVHDYINKAWTEWFEQSYYLSDSYNYIGLIAGDIDSWYEEKYNEGRPIIKLSDILSDSTTETKDIREYEEKLLNEWFSYLYGEDRRRHPIEDRINFLNRRYPTKELLQEKDELLKRLAEINQQLGVE